MGGRGPRERDINELHQEEGAAAEVQGEAAEPPAPDPPAPAAGAHVPRGAGRARQAAREVLERAAVHQRQQHQQQQQQQQQAAARPRRRQQPAAPAFDEEVDDVGAFAAAEGGDDFLNEVIQQRWREQLGAVAPNRVFNKKGKRSRSKRDSDDDSTSSDSDEDFSTSDSELDSPPRRKSSKRVSKSSKKVKFSVTDLPSHGFSFKDQQGKDHKHLQARHACLEQIFTRVVSILNFLRSARKGRKKAEVAIGRSEGELKACLILVFNNVAILLPATRWAGRLNLLIKLKSHLVRSWEKGLMRRYAPSSRYSFIIPESGSAPREGYEPSTRRTATQFQQ